MLSNCETDDIYICILYIDIKHFITNSFREVDVNELKL